MSEYNSGFFVGSCICTIVTFCLVAMPLLAEIGSLTKETEVLQQQLIKCGGGKMEKDSRGIDRFIISKP